VGGWVENSFINPPPCAARGLTCASGATAGWISIGIWRAMASRRRRAPASGSGRPRISAATRSASNSRCRETAYWMIIAAIGPISMITMATSGWRPSPSFRPPPNSSR